MTDKTFSIGMESDTGASSKRHPRQRVVQTPLSPTLRVLLWVVIFLFALLGANSLYLFTIRVLEWSSETTLQNFFYLQMFLLHLVLGVLLIFPLAVFLVGHIRRVYRHRNRRAVRAGYGLLVASLVLLISGILLTRIPGLIEINQPQFRAIVFWLHLISPLAVIWLYILHRLAGRKIKWRIGAAWGSVTIVFIGLIVAWQNHDPRQWNVRGPDAGVAYFFPSLSRTTSGNFIPADTLDNNQYCLECHTEAHRGWMHSAHRFSSFNNPAYLFSIKNTRQALMERDGSVHASRFCAGCHDPVPFFSGAFDDPKFDDPDYDLSLDALAQAGITCTSCHAISSVAGDEGIHGVVGNGSYTIDEPIHYPFTSSENPAFRWLSRQLVKAKPDFHKKTFLKPLHQTTEFCGACHKVHLPAELNDYKWLRGQNHYDSFWLSGVSGHNVESFYYPPVAETNCNGCHMPLQEVEHSRAEPNFSARIRDDSGKLKTFDHQFPSANTALPHLMRATLPDHLTALQRHEEFNRDIVRIDLFGIRDNGRIDGSLKAPLDIVRPVLVPGKEYLLETVVRTLKLGHFLTQGTADSNEIWLDVTLRLNGQIIGRSGGMDANDRTVDPWSHFLNAFVIDRDGFRINRRNAEDIFVALYDNQIPPGAAATVHYAFRLPADAAGEIEIEAHLRYRKFDTEFMRLVHEGLGLVPEGEYVNDLPIMTLARDSIRLVVSSEAPSEAHDTGVVKEVPVWQRWNDFGIGLLLRGQLRQAEEAFQQIEAMNIPDGPMNLARVYLREGRVAEAAPNALMRAREMIGPNEERAPEWTLLWLSGLVNKQNADNEAAIHSFLQIIDGGFAQATGRDFHFERDYRLLNELADTYYLLASQQRAEDLAPERETYLRLAEKYYLQAHRFDSESVATHYGLHRTYNALGMPEDSERHAILHQKYKIDDNVRDFAVAEARRRYPHANHAAEQVVIYDLQRPENFELTEFTTNMNKPITPNSTYTQPTNSFENDSHSNE